jgi:hypothetical protein
MAVTITGFRTTEGSHPDDTDLNAIFKEWSVI